MNAKHTPGPWMLSKSKRDATIRVVTAWAGADRSTVADCGPIGTGIGTDFRRDHDGYANARLLAAAPDLLAALADLVEVACPSGWDTQEDRAAARAKVAAARAAIARANGGAS